MLPGLLCRVVPAAPLAGHVPISDRGCPLGVPHLVQMRSTSTWVVLPTRKTQCQNTRSSRIPRVWMDEHIC